MDQIALKTCLFCNTAVSDAEYFIVGPEISGVCGECVGYLMSVMAVDDFAQFENHVELARSYGKNAEDARRDGSGSPTDLKN